MTTEAMTDTQRIPALEREIEELQKRLDRLENIVAAALEKVVAEDIVDYGAPHNTSAECRAHACSYYTAYLTYGPAYLTHEAFHGAERGYDSHLDTHIRDDGFHWVSAESECPTCDRWKKAVRA